EDGIRDFHVTGVQTCALPISACFSAPECPQPAGQTEVVVEPILSLSPWHFQALSACANVLSSASAPPNLQRKSVRPIFSIRSSRSEERRVGKECRPRMSGHLR